MAQQLGYSDAFFTREWKVSGLWNSILKDSIGQGPYQIAPEAYPNDFDTQSNRADLRVSHMQSNGNIWDVSDHPVICFEAKKGAAHPDWIAVREQIEDWCSLADGIQKGFPCWAIGAIGREVKFWIYTGSILSSGNNSSMVPVGVPGRGNPNVVIGWSQNGWEQGDNADKGASYDYNAPEVPVIINYMLVHRWAHDLIHPGGVD